MMQYTVIRKIRITAADGNNNQIYLNFRGERETEPQINADERRFIDRGIQQHSTYGKPQCSGLKHIAFKNGNETINSTRMTHIKQMFSYPCKSAPSPKSAFYRTDPRTKTTDGEVSGVIGVHPRFFYDVTFQTGFTGCTGYYFNHDNLVMINSRENICKIDWQYNPGILRRC